MPDDLTDTFANRVLEWFDQHGRKDLPWQQNPTPYRVWISEIMLQQTQVTTVIPYFQRFMQRFPEVTVLANASEDAVLQHWAGLGYYSRARNLHKAAKIVSESFGDELPEDIDALQTLPGIGRSTAGAILSLALNQSQPILDGNVKRVLARYHALEGWPGSGAVLQQLWQYAQQHLPASRNAAYTQAMMDMGATLCTRSKPNCPACPLQTDCRAFELGNPGSYPSAKPRKTLPEKQAVMLMIFNAEEQLFILKRPPSGIWGGLWSLPEFETLDAATAWYQQYFDEVLPDVEEFARITHTFSHFKLHIQALRLQTLADKTGIMEASQQLWYKDGTEFTGGFPAPIEKLLKRTLI